MEVPPLSKLRRLIARRAHAALEGKAGGRAGGKESGWLAVLEGSGKNRRETLDLGRLCGGEEEEEEGEGGREGGGGGMSASAVLGWLARGEERGGGGGGGGGGEAECTLWDQTGRLPLLFLTEGGKEGRSGGGVQRVVGWGEGKGGWDFGQSPLTRWRDEGVVVSDDGIERREDAVAGLPWYVPSSLPPSFPHLVSSFLPPSLPPSLPPVLGQDPLSLIIFKRGNAGEWSLRGDLGWRCREACPVGIEGGREGGREGGMVHSPYIFFLYFV